MTPSNKTSTLRANGFSIVNVRGNVTLYSHTEPFTFGAKARLAERGSNGRYEISKPGQFATQAMQPYTMALVD